jgi:hypothetical protein
MTTQELINRYIETRESLTEKAKAEAESQLWEHWKSNENKKAVRTYPTRREWAQNTFKFPVFEFEIRAQFLQAGPWVDPLWKLVDEGMSRHVAVRIFRQTKVRVAKERLTYEVALEKEITDYNSMGYIARTAGGRLCRRRTPDERFRTNPPSSIDIEMDMDGTQNARSKQLMTKVTAIAEEYLRTSVQELSEIDSMTMKLAKEEFISVVRETVEDFRRKIGNMRHQSKQDRIRSSRISRDILRGASEVLGVPVVYGSDVDLRKAKKIMLRRCAQLHPDKAGPMSEQHKAEYTAVVNAYKTLETYMEGRKPNEDGERNHAGK